MGVRQTSGLRSAVTGRGLTRHPAPSPHPQAVDSAAAPGSGSALPYVRWRLWVGTNKPVDLLAGWLKGRRRRAACLRPGWCLGAHQACLAGKVCEGSPVQIQYACLSLVPGGERAAPARGAATVQGPLSPRR